MRKAAANNMDHFQVQVISMVGQFAGETGVPPTAYGWKADDWVHIRITWDLTVGQGVPNVRVYFDRIEASQYMPQSTGSVSLGAESPSVDLYIGAWSDADNETASGVIDNFVILDDVVPP